MLIISKGLSLAKTLIKASLSDKIVINFKLIIIQILFTYNWLHYFNSTVDELFEGQVAFLAKQRAKSIATIMQIKMAQMK